jgi:Domain of unknown function (DUF4287)
MTTQKLFKRRVRERMSKTGESYTAARRHVAPRRDRVEAARSTTDLASARELASDERITEATGRSWEAWLSILDRSGARDRKHREVVDFLIAEHAVPGWWAQAITTGYERVRGMRLKHQQPDGFTIYASRTVGVPLDVLFDAFVDERTRNRWLTDGSMSLRTAQPGKIARFEWGEGPSRVFVTFEEKGPSKATAHVTHERLPDPDAADSAKADWKKRVASLKAFLESTDV